MDESTDLGKAHLRIARLSNDLTAVVAFYRDGLGFEVLDEFTEHAPTEDNLLVFYLPAADEWTRAVTRLEALGHESVRAFNPYWDKTGKTFEDPDDGAYVDLLARHDAVDVP